MINNKLKGKTRCYFSRKQISGWCVYFRC